jgi:predicted transcriptional regulator
MVTAVMDGLVEFERLHAAATQTDLQRAVEEAEADVSEGRLVEHDDMMAQLRRWADE